MKKTACWIPPYSRGRGPRSKSTWIGKVLVLLLVFLSNLPSSPFFPQTLYVFASEQRGSIECKTQLAAPPLQNLREKSTSARPQPKPRPGTDVEIEIQKDDKASIPDDTPTPNDLLESRRVVLRSIHGGSFQRWKSSETIQVPPFYIMDAPLTQSTWAQIVHLGHQFQALLSTAGPKLRIQPTPSQFENPQDPSGLLPVENVSFQEVVTAIWIINQLSLKSLGRYSRIASALRAVFEDYKPGDVYRLPLREELELLGHRFKKSLSAKKESGSIDPFFWYGANSDGRTHSIAQLKPFTSDDHEGPIYDLYGNVSEYVLKERRLLKWPWSECSYDEIFSYPHLQELLDALLSQSSDRPKRVLAHGGNWSSPTASDVYLLKNKLSPHLKYPTVGFRLVRVPRTKQPYRSKPQPVRF